MSLQAEGYGSPEEIENLYRVARDERVVHHGLDKGKDVSLTDPHTGRTTAEAKEPYQNGYYGQYNSSTYGYSYGYGQGVYLPSGYEIDPVRVAAEVYAEQQAERPRQRTNRSRRRVRPQYEATETYEDDSEVVYYDDEEQEAPSPKRSRKKSAKASARSAVDQARLKKVEQRVDSLEKDSATTKDILNSHMDE